MQNTIIIWIIYILQFSIAIGLINVWVLRFGRATKYRGVGSHDMKEEFAAYGLPVWSLYVVGFFKILIALILIFVLFMPQFNMTFGIAALGVLIVLMLGAIGVHIKVKDSLKKTFPAILMLAMSLLTIYLLFLI